MSRTVTRSIETEAAVDDVVAILRDAHKIPAWAPVFADSVEAEAEGRWRITKDGSSFEMEMVVEPSSRTIDYLREMGPGKKAGAYIRVLPRPGDGSVVVMTVPVAPGVEPKEVAEVLEQELSALVALCHR